MNKVLVVVYSYTGTSRRVADLLTSQQGWPVAEIHETHARRGAFGAEGTQSLTSTGSGYEFGSSGPSATALARAARKEAASKTEWANKVTGTVRDNGDLTLAAGDRIRHVDFGDGRVAAVTGEGNKRVAEVHFDTAGRKRLLIKIAPIEKI